MNHRLRKDANRILSARESPLRPGAAGGGVPADDSPAGARLSAALAECERLGYEVRMGDRLQGDYREAGRDLANRLRAQAGKGRSVAILYADDPVPGGEDDLWGHHQLAMAAAPGISGLRGAAVFSVGAQPGRTGLASGGYVDEDTMETLSRKGLDVFRLLRDDDSYIGLRYVDGLIFSGSGAPLTVALIRA